MQVACTVLFGEWSNDTAGGCDVHPLWRKNPRFHLFMPSGGRARIELKRLTRIKHPVDGMIGFYLLRCANPECDIKGDMRKAVVAESTFVPDEQVGMAGPAGMFGAGNAAICITEALIL